MNISEFDYTLPKEFIAQEPATERDKSRLLVLDRVSRDIEHTIFHNLLQYLRGGDVVVLNDTKVIPARIAGRRSSGGKVEVLIVRGGVDGSSRTCEVLLDTPRRIKEGERLHFVDDIECSVLGRSQEGRWTIEFNRDIFSILNDVGMPPLPPYIKRSRGTTREDAIRYQTVYAKKDGSIAAPTAGLHFTPELLGRIRGNGIETVYITLHVGIGTFRPIKVSEIERHKMEAEYYEVSYDVATVIQKAKMEGRRVIAIGTTTTRVLESLSEAILSPLGASNIRELSGWTDIFIYPPYNFTIVDALITNFHLPKSTLLLLTCAFASKDRVFAAYGEAKKMGYRFYSYGDAMLIV